MPTGNLGLYVHVPFCSAKCRYCHFFSVPWDPAAVETWKKGIALEAEAAAVDGCVFDSLYIGGGTPSLLSPDDLIHMTDSLRKRLNLRLEEFTLEVNPGAFESGLFRGWRKAGVTRLSVGVQSFEDGILRRLGRTGYRADEAVVFLDAARREGFADIAVDLIAGIPGETRLTVERNLAALDRLGIDHVSVYFLEELEGRDAAADLVLSPDEEDGAVRRFESLAAGLESLGIVRYEISNFARPGRACRHNLKYWRYEPFLGLGPSAASHVGNVRWTNVSSIEKWSRALEKGQDPRDEVLELSGVESFREALAFGLRLDEGLDPEKLGRRFGIAVQDTMTDTVESLRKEGSLIVENGRWRIPRERMLISNTILSSLIYS
ncbi:MAG: radical SAM family heme chaperone HemW [Acidobacteriota bacterium]|nr:radical SAM family heme chaperone HemW [Acidobacteriota bacterium]